MLLNISLIILGYLCGSISSAVVVCKLMGLADPRTQGSNNPGATNVLRLHGKKAAIVTLSGDVIKGFVPVFITWSMQTPPDWVTALTALAAFSGHLFPVFFGFRGGKGVATLIGVLFGMYWLLGIAFILTWLVTAALFRYSSLSALLAAASIPVITVWLQPSLPYIAAITIMVLLLFWRHRGNIRNLLAGKEDKIGHKSDI